jgi:hypothetical protein
MLSGGYFPTGSITFNLISPSNTIVYTDVVTVSGNGTYSTATMGNNPGGYLPTATGTYQWVAVYSGDGNNNGVSSNNGDEPEVVSPASPSITTQTAGTVVVGSGNKLNDSATLSGGFNPTGTITFSLTNPSNTVVYTDVVTVAGNGTYSTATMGNNPGGYLPTAAGTYQWVASYSGDSNNNPVSTKTGDEPEVVSPASPTITTVASPTGNQIMNTTFTVSDTATLHNAFNPTGSITFTLFSDANCTVSTGVTGSAPISNGSATFSASFTPTTAGTYQWIASYAGDANNNGFTTKCGDPNEQLTVIPPSAQITPTGTTCQQFSGGTASTLASFFYSVSGGNISTDNPGVFFYYEKVTITSGQTITVNETVDHTANYLLPVLNGSTSQVQVFDAACNTINGATIKIGSTGTSPYTVSISGLPAGTYIFSVKYTPKAIVGQPAPSPSTLTYSFSTAVNGTTVAGSTQGITGIKQ